MSGFATKDEPVKILKNAPSSGTPDQIPRARRVMAPSAAPAGHRPIHSFFRGVHEPCSTSTALSEAPAPAPAAPPPASVPAGSVPAWDRPNDRPVVAYARRRRGARSGDAASAGAREARDAKRAPVSDDRARADRDADEDEGQGRPGPSSSGRADEGEPGDDPDGARAPKFLKFPRAPGGKTKQLFLDLGQKSFGHVCTPRASARTRPRTRRTTPRTSKPRVPRFGTTPTGRFGNRAKKKSLDSRVRVVGASSPRRGVLPTRANGSWSAVAGTTRSVARWRSRWRRTSRRRSG